jgi:hypothetical protein
MLTKHALEQCEVRGIDPDKVRQAVSKHSSAITKHKQQVLVVVERYPRSVYCADGSNGDTVIAVVDPQDVYSWRNCVKTVFLRRSSQINNHKDAIVIG